jgi:hypothetical protein
MPNTYSSDDISNPRLMFSWLFSNPAKCWDSTSTVATAASLSKLKFNHTLSLYLRIRTRKHAGSAGIELYM